MAKFHTLPWKLEPYYADTKHLTCVQHGAYLQLLSLAWRSPDAAIDLSDDRKVARMISASRKEWLKMKPIILAFFEVGQDGLYRQKRLSAIYGKVEELVEKRRAAGKKGGRPRKDEDAAPETPVGTPAADPKPQESDRSQRPNGDANPLENNDSTKANAKSKKSSQSQSQSERDSKESLPPLAPKGEQGGEGGFPWPMDAWDRFIEAYPNKIGLGGSNGAKAHFQTVAARYGDRLDFNELIAAVHRYAENPGTTKYMHPRTWLSEERWRDQPAAPPAQAVAPPPVKKATRGSAALSELETLISEKAHGTASGTQQSRGSDFAAEGDGPLIEGTLADPEEQSEQARRRAAHVRKG